jgi:hypothetical protein
MFQLFQTFFRKTDIRGNGEKKTEITLYIFTRPTLSYCKLISNEQQTSHRHLWYKFRARCITMIKRQKRSVKLHFENVRGNERLIN